MIGNGLKMTGASHQESVAVVGSETSEDYPASLVRIVEALEEDIVFGRLHQRERLIEDDLLDRFKAKRHTVRQALAELERMGLVERVPNRGSSVRAFDPATVHNLYEVRELLETHAARLIPMPLSAESLENIKEVQKMHDAAVDSGDLRSAFRSNVQFHRTLFSYCGNPVLARAIEDFANRTHGIRFYSLANPPELQQSRAEHHAMIEALCSAEREAFIELCRAHIMRAMNLYLRAAQGSWT